MKSTPFSLKLNGETNEGTCHRSMSGSSESQRTPLANPPFCKWTDACVDVPDCKSAAWAPHPHKQPDRKQIATNPALFMATALPRSWCDRDALTISAHESTFVNRQKTEV